MSGSESDSEGEYDNDSINEDLEWLLNYANDKFDSTIDDIKQFITTTPSHKSSINNKKITSAIWNAFTSTSRCNADNSEGRHFNFKEDFPSETPSFCSPFHRYSWSTTGNSIGWTRTKQYSNSGTGCIKSPHLLSSTSNTKRYSDLIFEYYHLYSKCTYLILSVHASLFEPIDRFTVFVDGEYQATIDATSAFEFVAIKVESKINKKHTIKFRYEYNPFDLDTLPESPQGHLGAVFIDDVYFISTATDIELEMPNCEGTGHEQIHTPEGFAIVPRMPENLYILHNVELMQRHVKDFSNIAETFEQYSGKKFKYHPFNQHTKLIQGVVTRMNESLSELKRIVINNWKSNKHIGETTPTPATINNVLESILDITKTIRSLVVVFQNDILFSKLHVIKVVTRYPKQSTERGKAMKALSKGGHVPSQSALYDVLKCHEKGILVADEEWNIKRGRKRKKSSKSESQGRIGSIELALIPVVFTDNLTWEPDITVSFFAPPKTIDLCDYIGGDGDEDTERLYFSPRQFPTPVNLTAAGEEKYFGRLKEYIRRSSETSGSPVVCNGGSGFKQFVCRHAKNQKMKVENESNSCSFQFLVKWDKYGYYVHLFRVNRDNMLTSVGCRYHNH